LDAGRITGIVTVVILAICMLVFPIAALETDIPTADYELTLGEETNESESIEISNSTYSPVSSVLVTNESVKSPTSYWTAIHFPGSDSSYFEKIVSVPYINVSDLILTVSAHIVEGPVEISMEENSVIGQTGEKSKLVVHMVPDVDAYHTGRSSTEYIRITIDRTDWDVIDEIYFSLEAVFTENVCPITIDLQRTNGESMYLLPEFRTIHDYNALPYYHFEEFLFIVFQPNVTLFIPNGNYSLSFHWMEYSHSFVDLSIMNESLRLILRIKSVRLDVESLQKIPGLAIEVDYHGSYGYRHMYNEEYMIKGSPSFYLPSENTVHIWVEGRPSESLDRPHFDFVFEAGEDHDVTLLVDENWIIVGNVAITPSRTVMFVSVFLIVGTILAFARKKIWMNPIFAPFILLLLGNLLPVFNVSSQRFRAPVTSPIYSIYQEFSYTSLTFDTTYSHIDESILTISNRGGIESFLPATIMAQLSFVMLFIVFLGVVFEIIEKRSDTSEAFFLLGLFATPIFHSYNFAYFFASEITIGVGFFVMILAIPLWLVLITRKNQAIRTLDD